MDCSPPGSSVHRISQARILEWVTIFSSPIRLHFSLSLVIYFLFLSLCLFYFYCLRIESGSPGLTGRFFTEPPGKPRSTVQFSLVAQSCLTLCDPMNCSTPDLPVHHQLPEFTQTHVHWVSDAIQPSHPLSSPSPPATNPSQHHSLFQWVNSSREVAKVLEFQL